jgi:hypothetical protein
MGGLGSLHFSPRRGTDLIATLLGSSGHFFKEISTVVMIKFFKDPIF